MIRDTATCDQCMSSLSMTCIIDTVQLMVIVDSCSEGEVQLVGPSSAFAGRVELCIGFMWTTVCDDFWDNRDASVLCRQLGYSPYGMLLVNIAHRSIESSRYRVSVRGSDTR